MNNIEWIPMEKEYKNQLKYAYFRPLRRNMILLFLSMVSIPTRIIYRSIERNDYYVLLFIIPFVCVYAFFADWLAKYKLHYYHDYKLGHIMKESTFITQVFPTPSGTNIDWLGSASIKTFIPNPYHGFSQNDPIIIYYLKNSKEYLAYER